MTQPFKHAAIAILLLLLSFESSALAAPNVMTPPAVSFEISPRPPWVTAVTPAHSGDDGDSGGISYLVIDRQSNVGLKAAYYHEARHITSQNGVQYGASVTVSFDPSYQRLRFHSIDLIRDGVRANRLDRSQIKLFQREKDMESFLYDGTYTAQCDLEDVRVGDIIEFAYTIEGTNPVKGERYSRLFYTDWNSPAHRAVTRLLYPANRKLNFLTKNRPIKPVIKTTGAVTEWLCDETKIPGRRTDPDVPPDYDPNGWVQISEFKSWQEVVEWAVPLFTAETTLSPDLRAEIDKLRQIPDVEKRILAALRLVQEQVRYLGIESGIGSHRPTAPSEVLRRRFGDCKDKALLLVTMLRQTGVEATPALVSTIYRGGVAERLPAPEDFDHAIVQVKNGDQTHWLDATRSNQRGPLSQIHVGDFRLALLLRPGTKELTPYAPPRDSLPRKQVTENFRVPPPGETGELEVVTESHGLSAERVRSQFQESSRDKIQKLYLQYYARRFPRITVKKPLVYEEIADANACRTREFYSIPDIWERNDEEKKHQLSLYPGDAAEAMGSAGPGQRDDPLALNYPASIVQKINAEMFDEWSLEIKNQPVRNAFFRFADEAAVDGRHIRLTYTYETLSDRVPPADLPAYNAALSKVRDSLGYMLSYRPPGESFDFMKMVRNFHWPLALLASGVLTVTMVLCALYVYKSKLPAPLPPPPAGLRPLQGLGGWLILVAIHHLIRPFVFLVGLFVLFPTVFDLERWRALTQPGGAVYHPIWAPALLFELFYNVVCLVVSGLLLILFFRKRAVWPRCYAAFLLVILIGVELDTYLVQSIPGAAATSGTNVRDVVEVIVAAVIWVPYCFVSRRVKETFRY
jgi:transglutaminase-like putative cysteine protease